MLVLKISGKQNYFRIIRTIMDNKFISKVMIIFKKDYFGANGLRRKPIRYTKL